MLLNLRFFVTASQAYASTLMLQSNIRWRINSLFSTIAPVERVHHDDVIGVGVESAYSQLYSRELPIPKSRD